MKQYSARANEINPDTLQIKLMHLDETARSSNHPDRELYASVLNRFLCNKKHPKIGFLITSLLSTAAEAKLFEKEQKFLKIYGKHGEESTKNVADSRNAEDGDGKHYEQWANMMHFMQSFMRMPQPTPGVRMPFNLRRGGFNNVRPRLSPSYTGCHKCGDFTHLKADCPKK